MKHLIALVALSAVLVAPSHADVVYSSAAAFVPNAGPNAYTENFTNAATPGTVNSMNFSNGAYSYTISSSVPLYGNGEFFGVFNNTGSLVINFTGAAVHAIGGNFFNTSNIDAFLPTELSLTFSNGAISTFTPISFGSYRGFIFDDTITSLTLTKSAGANFVSLDNFTVGGGLATQVPEPGSLALVGLAALSLLAARRRQR